jgi:hypothetical protein
VTVRTPAVQSSSLLIGLRKGGKRQFPCPASFWTGARAATRVGEHLICDRVPSLVRFARFTWERDVRSRAPLPDHVNAFVAAGRGERRGRCIACHPVLIPILSEPRENGR